MMGWMCLSRLPVMEEAVGAASGHPWPPRHSYILYIIKPNASAHPAISTKQKGRLCWGSLCVVGGYRKVLVTD